MAAAFLCASWNETRFPALLAQIGRRKGGFGAEMREIVARVSEEVRDKRDKPKEEIQQLGCL